MIIELIKKTYRIIRNRGDTINRGKIIVQQTREVTHKGKELIADISADGIHFDDLQTLQQNGGEIRNEVENIANEVGNIGDKIGEETKKYV